jgi:hypothetical protein
LPFKPWVEADRRGLSWKAAGVGERLGHGDVDLVDAALSRVEEIQGADDPAVHTQGQRVHRTKPCFERFGCEPGPTAIDRGEVLVHDGFAAAVAVEAGTFLGLQLEQLEETHRGHHPQVAVWCDKHDARAAIE